jgi:hypothetical protein
MGMPLPQGADHGVGRTGHGEPPGTPASQPPPPRRRRPWLRALAWAGGILGAVLLLVLGALLIAPLWVESDSGRRWIEATAREQGVDLAYDELTLRPLSGRLVWENVRLAMPAPHAHVAEHWLTIARVELRWSPGALLAGRLHVQRFGIEGVRAHVVVDEQGEDSFSLFLQGLPEDPEPDEDPPVPLSHTLADLEMPLGIVLDDLSIRDVRAQLTQLFEGNRTRTSVLDGLELSAWLRMDGAPLEAEVVEGSVDRPEGTQLVVTDVDEDGEQVRELDLHLTNRVTVREGRTATHLLTVDVLRQTFDDDVTFTGRLLTAETAAHFLPDEGTTRFELNGFNLLDEVATATLAMALRDSEALPRLEGGRASLRLDPLVRLLPARLGTFESEDVGAEMEVHPAKDAAAGRARVGVRGRAGRLSATVDDTTAGLEAATWTLDAEVSPDTLEAALRATVARLAATTPEGAVEVTDTALTLDAKDLRFEGDPLTVIGQVGTTLALGTVRAQAEADTVRTRDVRLEATVDFAPDRTLSPSLRVALGETVASLGAGTRIQVAPFRLEVDATDVTPELDELVRFEGRGGTARVQLDTGPGEGTTVEGLDLRMSGHYAHGASFTVRTDTGVAAVVSRSPGSTTRVRDARLKLALEDVALHEEEPMRSTATVKVDTRAATVELVDEAQTVAVQAPRATVEGRYLGRRPSNFQGTLGLEGARLTRDGKTSRLLSAGELTWSVKDLVLDEDNPLRSHVELEANGRFAPVTLSLEGALAKGDGQANLHLRVESFEPFRSLLDTSGVGELDLAGSGMEVHGRGTWQGLDSDAPTLDHHLEANVSKVGYHQPDLDVRLPRIGLVVDHKGRALDHHATLRAEIARPEVNHQALDGSIVLAAKADVNGSKGEARLESSLGGIPGLDVRATAHAVTSLDGRVEHTEQVTVAQLGGLAPLIPPEIREVLAVDLQAIRMEVDGRGRVDGLFDPPGPDGAPAPTPYHQTLQGTLGRIHYTPEGLVVDVPETRFEVDARGDADGMAAQAELHVPRIEVEDGDDHHLILHDLRQEVRLTAQGEGETGRTTIELEGGIARVDQDISPAYPMEDVAVSGRLVMDGLTSVELERFVLENRRGGTTLELQKTLTRGEGADAGATRGLALQGKLSQVLDRLDGDPKTLVARGRVEAPFTVDSADGSLFRVQAILELRDVNVELPELDVIIEGLNARVPMEEAIEWTEAGMVVVPTTERNVFARVRFQDVQPFLSGDSHIEARRFHWNEVEVGPVMGSMRVEGNVFSVDKMKVHKDDALISGQLVIDYQPGAERITFRGNVTGLKPRGSDDPLDANAAIVFDPNRLEMDGRIQIVRVSRKHLLALIDLVDPFREDPSMNSLRGGLKYGYPKQVRISMAQGLMSMKVDLGGLIGGLIKLGEIQGVSLGPFLNQHVAPYLPW